MLDNALLKDIAAKNGDARLRTRDRGAPGRGLWGEPAVGVPDDWGGPRLHPLPEPVWRRCGDPNAVAGVGRPASAVRISAPARPVCREGTQLKHKTLRRLYTEERLQVRRRGEPNQRWSLDFVSSLFGLRVARELDAVIAARGRPLACVSDDGTSFPA